MMATGGQEHGARSFLLGVSGRALHADAGGGEPLLYAAHEKLRDARLRPGERIYLGGFADGKLALLGRVVARLALEPPAASRVLGEPISAFCVLGGPPFTSRQPERVVPEHLARGLRTSAGGGLRFTRRSAYELHPGALLGLKELDEGSAASLDALLDDVALPKARYPEAQVPHAIDEQGPAHIAAESPMDAALSVRASRDADIVARRGAGETVAELARRFGLSQQRIGQITARARTASRIDPESGRLTPDQPADGAARLRFSDADLLAAIRAVAERCGETPTAREYRILSREAGLPSAQAIEYRFGGWVAAVRAAGMTPRRRGRRGRRTPGM